MSELSHFEELSAKTPMQQPLAILIGAALLPFLLVIINWLSPTEEVKKLKNLKDRPAVTQTVDDDEI